MKLSDLQRKDIVNINNGKKVGKIIDVEIDSNNGSMISLIVEKGRYFRSVFNSESEVLVKFDQIKKMGEDVILVDLS
jgi:YlmC/YmxH family sporulation protein